MDKAQDVVVWVDADSCPVLVRDVLVRASRNRQFSLEFLSCAPVPLPEGAHATVVGADTTVDEVLCERAAARAPRGAPRDGETRLAWEGPAHVLVVTRDIPLAERLVAWDVAVMNDRGELFDRESVRERRSLRDAHAAIRAMGLEEMDRRRRFGEKEKRAFANALDRYLTSRQK